jgi:hypothetical protein
MKCNHEFKDSGQLLSFFSWPLFMNVKQNTFQLKYFSMTCNVMSVTDKRILTMLLEMLCYAREFNVSFDKFYQCINIDL